MRYFRRSMRITVAAAGGPIAAAQRWSVRWGSVPRIVSVLRAPYRAHVHSEKPNRSEDRLRHRRELNAWSAGVTAVP
jgi:hypothetical protein